MKTLWQIIHFSYNQVVKKSSALEYKYHKVIYGLRSFSSRRLIYTIFFLQEMFKTLSKVSLYENIFTIRTRRTATFTLPPSYVTIYTVQKASWKSLCNKQSTKCLRYSLRNDHGVLNWREWQTLSWNWIPTQRTVQVINIMSTWSRRGNQNWGP